MEYVTLGTTGLQVSRICLGCMSYGEPTRGNQPWSLDRDAATPFYRQALDAGINFFDTANVYSLGSSEEITGQTLLSMTDARRGRHRHQGARPDAPWSQWHTDSLARPS